MERGKQMARQWSIFLLLSVSPSGLTVREIVSRIGARPRTIYRDIDVLLQMGLIAAVSPRGDAAAYKAKFTLTPVSEEP